VERLRLRKEKQRLILVDGPNLLGIKRQMKEALDEEEFFKLLSHSGKTHIFYYYQPREIGKADEEQERPFLGYLDFLEKRLWQALIKEGISLKTFPATRGDVDVMITTDIAISLFKGSLIGLKEEIDEIVLVSGDGGFARILQVAKEEGKKITVIAGKENCSRRLMEVADDTLYIEELLEGHPELILNYGPRLESNSKGVFLFLKIL